LLIGPALVIGGHELLILIFILLLIMVLITIFILLLLLFGRRLGVRCRFFHYRQLGISPSLFQVDERDNRVAGPEARDSRSYVNHFARDVTALDIWESKPKDHPKVAATDLPIHQVHSRLPDAHEQFVGPRLGIGKFAKQKSIRTVGAFDHNRFLMTYPEEARATHSRWKCHVLIMGSPALSW
jgi:hypothetical protein